MRKSLALLLATIGFTTLVKAAVVGDIVHSLPDVGPLPSTWYSGYLDITETKSIHYIYIESLDKPTTDPIVLWMNGGPGCSSLIGLFSENGPFVFDDGESVIKPNPYSWN